MTVARSLFDAGDETPIASAGEWIAGVLSGSAATSLCIVAVATLGLLMLSGRLAVRRGMEVVLGCFLLLGASTIAVGLLGLGEVTAREDQAPVPLVIEREEPPPLPPANYDPYAGASLRRH